MTLGGTSPPLYFTAGGAARKNIQTNAATGISSTLDTNQRLKYMCLTDRCLIKIEIKCSKM